MASRTRRRAGGAAVLAAAVVLPAVLAGPAGAQEATFTTSAQLQADVTLDGVLRHVDRFQRIADRNNGNRAAGTPGGDASARYLYGQLQRAGLAVSYQDFDFPYFELASSSFEQTAPTPTVYTDEGDAPTYIVAEYSGSGSADGQVVEVDVQEPPGPAAGSSTSGCEAADFAGFPVGGIALIQRGTCTFADKAANAQAAGASAVILYNEGQEGRTDVFPGTLGGPGVTIPVLNVSYATGRSLVGATVALSVEAVSETRSTRNVIAETRGGDAENVVVLGAHYDGVIDGPGQNDNGAGAAALLEVARQYANDRTNQKVRFAFWSAEEQGLLGAEDYVANLAEEDRARIKAYLNFDMIASPNFARFVYDGDGSATPDVSDDAGPAGSEQIEQTLQDYFAARALYTDPTDFDGRSDYGPFIAVGIPSGGIFTGAEGIKTPEQAERYGGTAGEAYDPCYHQECDSRTNLNLDALDQNADAIAHLTALYGFDISTLTSSVTPPPAPSGAAASGGAAEQDGPLLTS